MGSILACLRAASPRLATKLGQLVSRAEYNEERFVLTRNGRAVAALVPIEVLEAIGDLGQDPRPAGSVTLAGSPGRRRIRVGLATADRCPTPRDPRTPLWLEAPRTSQRASPRSTAVGPQLAASSGDVEDGVRID